MIVQSDQNSLDHIRKESEKRLGPRVAPPPRQKLGMGDFLHLMISQLQYQDPLHPLNNTRFAAQLAQFSQLDQLTHLNRGVGTIAHDGADANKMMMVGFLGQRVTMKGNAFRLDPSGNVSLTYRQAGASQSGHLRIFDGQNHLVRTIALKPMGPGSHTLEWDGVTDQGVRAPKGSYSFEIDAMDGRHRPVAATPSKRGPSPASCSKKVNQSWKWMESRLRSETSPMSESPGLRRPPPPEGIARTGRRPRKGLLPEGRVPPVKMARSGNYRQQ